MFGLDMKEGKEDAGIVIMVRTRRKRVFRNRKAQMYQHS